MIMFIQRFITVFKAMGSKNVQLYQQCIIDMLSYNTFFNIFSIFYVFYEQYLTIVHDTVFNLCLCVAAIFIVTFVLLGFDFFSALMIVITVSMIVVDILGFMYLWNISLNAISLVNLVMVRHFIGQLVVLWQFIRQSFNGNTTVFN